MEVSGQLYAPAALPPGKEPLVHIRQEAGRAPGPVWTRCRRGTFPAPTGIRTPLVQSVVSHYTDCLSV